MGSKGSSTSTKTSAPPAYLNAAYQSILGQAQNLAAQPYTPYTGQLTAGLNAQQGQAIGNLSLAQGIDTPYLNQASQSLGNVSTVAPTAYTSEEIAKYQSPYTQQVVDATSQQLKKVFGEQQNALVGNAIQSGAWGGNRAALAQANLAGNQADTAANTIANLYNTGFSNAQSQFNTANQAQMNAAQTNNTNALNLGSLYSGLGTTAANNTINMSNALLGAGQVAQNTTQNDLNAQYQQFLNQQGWDQNQLTWLANLATGIGGSAGGTTTGTSPSGGNIFSSILGAGLSLASLLPASDKRVKEDIEPVGKLYDGQTVYRFKYLGDTVPHIGLMAQEVEKTSPDAVYNPDGILRIDYDVATEDAAEMGRGEYASGGYVPKIAGPGESVGPLLVGLQIPEVQQGRGGMGAPGDSGDSGGGSGGGGGFGGLGIDKETAKSGLSTLGGLFGSKGATTEAIAAASPLDAITFGLKFADGGAVDEEGIPLLFGPEPMTEPDNAPLIFGPTPEPAPGLAPRDITPRPSASGTMFAGTGRLPRGIRTNNPGNIKDGPFARSLPGYVGSDGVNAIFETPQAGLGAMDRLLDSYGRRGLNTVSGILNRWAPPDADNNDTGGYVNYVSKRLGVDPNAPLTPEARAQLPAAMAYFENGREFPMSGNPLAVADASTGRITPRAAPSSAGSDEAEIPANAMAAQGTAPQGLGGFNPLGLSDDMRSALLVAGLGMLSGQSRNAGENIGQGALYGLVNYQNRQDAARKAEIEAARLQRELQNDARKATLDERRLQLDEQKAGQGRFTVVGPIQDNNGQVTGTALLNNLTGEISVQPVATAGKTASTIDQRKRDAAAAGLDPSSPAYQGYLLTGKMPREDMQPLSATDKKAILESDEMVLAAQTAIDNLKQAQELSKKALEGPAASFRGNVGALFGNEASEATVNLDNLVMTNALSQLKAIFGAAPTEGERKILLEIQGSASQPDKIRQEIYKRAIAMAEKRLEMNKSRAEELRGGSFYKPKTEADPVMQAREAIRQGADREAVIRRLKDRGISTEGL